MLVSDDSSFSIGSLAALIHRLQMNKPEKPVIVSEAPAEFAETELTKRSVEGNNRVLSIFQVSFMDRVKSIGYHGKRQVGRVVPKACHHDVSAHTLSSSAFDRNSDCRP